MFDISWGELVLVGMVALIVIGPKELPTVLRTVGQWMTKVRRMASEFQGQFHEAMREAEFADLKKQVDSISDPSQYNPLETVQKEIDGAFSDPPVTPSGEPAPPGEPATAFAAPEGDVTPSGEPLAEAASAAAMEHPPGEPAPSTPETAETAASAEASPGTPKPTDLEGGRAA
jgi:sec-independent protein translocase protein TatB